MFKTPLEWFRFTDRISKRWRVYFTTPTITKELTEMNCQGFLQPNRRHIYIDIRYDWVTQKEILIHELGHAAVMERESADRGLQEKAVVLVTIPLLGIISRKPFKFELPPRPLPWEEYRKWAVRTDGSL